MRLKFPLGMMLLLPALAAPLQGQQTGPTPPPVVRRVPDRRPVIVQGRVMGVPRVASRVEVRIESVSGALNDFVFAEATGRFVFRNVSLDPDDSYVIVVDAEGFKTYRESLDYHVDSRRGGNLTIFLEPAPVVELVGDASGQVVDLSQLTADIPNSARDAFDRARDHIHKEEFDEAIERLEDAVADAPDYFDALDALGAEYLRAGRLEEADVTLSRAHELSPASARPLLSLGTLRYQQGESLYQSGNVPAAVPLFTEAVEFLEQSIRRDPGLPQAYHNLGQTQYRLAQYPESEASLRSALDLDPDYGDVRLALINVFTRQYRYADAIEQVDRYLERNPDDPRSASLERLRDQIEAALAP